jgi:hypothetical protein
VRKKLTLTGIRSPDRPTRSESLYRLSYSGLTDITPKSEIRVEIYFQQFQKYLLYSVSRTGGPQELVTILHLTNTAL